MPKPYPPEFRRRALDLLEAGRSVREVAACLGIAQSCLHHWKSRDLLDRGVKSPTPEQVESAALAAARARIAELETEVKILRKAPAAVEQVADSRGALTSTDRTFHGSPRAPRACANVVRHARTHAGGRATKSNERRIECVAHRQRNPDYDHSAQVYGAVPHLLAPTDLPR